MPIIAEKNWPNASFSQYRRPVTAFTLVQLPWVGVWVGGRMGGWLGGCEDWWVGGWLAGYRGGRVGLGVGVKQSSNMGPVLYGGHGRVAYR